MCGGCIHAYIFSRSCDNCKKKNKTGYRERNLQNILLYGALIYKQSFVYINTCNLPSEPALSYATILMILNNQHYADFHAAISNRVAYEVKVMNLAIGQVWSKGEL